MIFKKGKYAGQDASVVAQTDRGYVEWMMNSCLEGVNDPQWGNANRKRAEELNAILNADNPAVSIISQFNKGREEEEIATKISSKREAEINQKHSEIVSLEAKLVALDAKLEQLIKDVAIISWFVKGGKEEPVEEKPSDKYKWEE